jgi:DNA-directed RNA polymerase specialized sigma24 family protein
VKLTDKDRERLGRLADPARTHKELSEDARRTRDVAIYDAYVAGAKLADIAAACGVSVSTAHRVVVRETERRQPAISVE